MSFYLQFCRLLPYWASLWCEPIFKSSSVPEYLFSTQEASQHGHSSVLSFSTTGFLLLGDAIQQGKFCATGAARVSRAAAFSVGLDASRDRESALKMDCGTWWRWYRSCRSCSSLVWRYGNKIHICQLLHPCWHVQAQSTHLSHISVETFVLPKELAQRLKEISNQCYKGIGFSTVHGLDPTRYTPEQNVAIYAGIAAHVAPQHGFLDRDCQRVLC